MVSRALAAVPIVVALSVSALPAQTASDARWLAHCRAHGDEWRVKQCEVRVVTHAAGGPLVVDAGPNGAVAVEGWERDSIEVHTRIETQAGAEHEALALARELRIVTSGATISASGPSTALRASWAVSFAIYAPRRSDLRLDTHNGPIAVRDVTGRMTLQAYNGPVSLDAVGGDVHARTINGPLHVVLTGERWDGAGLDAETTNGPVHLAIPERYAAELEVGTVNGPMSVAFPLTVTIQGRFRRRITTTLGAGGAPVRVVTTNGPVEIGRN